MAKMYKCDRCGKKFSNKDIAKGWMLPSIVSIRGFDEKPRYAFEYDLCPKCARKFDNWMVAKKMKEKK